MNIILHKSSDRGHRNHGWLDTHFSFSFADWYEPSRMGFGALRVLNDDVIAPKRGFGMHPHDNMEIVTIVTRGAVTHRDNMGNERTISRGTIQAMSAGKGIVHSEMNESETEPLHLFQLWIEPRTRDIEPRYEERSVMGLDEQPGTSTLLASPDGEHASLKMYQDAYITLAIIDSGHPIQYSMRARAHGVYCFVIQGAIAIDDNSLESRDAAGLTEFESVTITGTGSLPASVLLIEVPMHHS